MEATRLALSLFVALSLLLALRIIVKIQEADILKVNEKELQQRSSPNFQKNLKKRASITLASEAATLSTEKQLFRRHERGHSKPYRHISGGSQGSLFNRNKFLQNRNRREVNDGNGQMSSVGQRAGNAETDGDGNEGLPSALLPAVGSNRTENSTSALNNTTHSAFTTPTKPATRADNINITHFTTATTKALHEEVSCESSLLSCRGRCVKGRDLGQINDMYLQCYCDEYCEIFTDCCYDYGHHCISGYRYPAGNVNIRSNISNTSTNVWGCISPPITKRTPSGTAGMWMIVDCPHHWTNASVREKCKLDSPLSFGNYEANIPVIAQDGKTYKNRFCSICHGIPEDEITNFPLDFSCDILPPSRYTPDKAMEFLFSYCSISWNPPISKQRRYCYSNVIDSCHKSASVTLQNNCKYGLPGIVCSGYGSYYFKYRNIYCATCHYATSLVCGPPVTTGVPVTKPKPFSIIMNLGFSSRPHSPAKRRQTRVFCPTSKVYDPHLELCRTGIENVPNQTNFDKYRVFAWLRNTTEIPNWSLATSNDDSDKAKKKRFFLSGFKLLLSTDSFLVSNAEVEVEGKTYRVGFDIETRQYMYNKTERIRGTINNQLTLNNLLDFTKPITVIIHSINFTIIKVTTRRLSCIELQIFFRHEYVILKHPESALYVNKTSELFQRQDYYLGISFNDSVDAISVCRRRLSFSCNRTYTMLSSDEVTELPNKSLIWKAGGRVYNEGYYEKQNGTIWICTNFSSFGTKEKSPEQTENSLVIITVLGLSLSVILLSALLITYCLIGELRTLPGINLMNLSFSLMLGHLLWLLGSGLTVELSTCTAIALALHFAFLSSFVWMTIIAIDTWRAFAKKSQRINRMSNRSKRKRYLRSMAVGWLSPLVFSGICFTLDQTNTVAIEYGGTKGCWLQNTSSRLYFFAVPMGVLLLINVVFFVVTVKAIRETVADAQMATTHNRRKQNLRVYMRIAALMGFTWVFGFLSSLHLYLAYVFVISCTLQGVYIAVAFLFTKRVAILVGKHCGKDQSSSHRVLSENVPRSDLSRESNKNSDVRRVSQDLHSLECRSNKEIKSENMDCQDTHL